MPTLRGCDVRYQGARLGRIRATVMQRRQRALAQARNRRNLDSQPQ